MECILPVGMLRLSAWRMMFVKMVYICCWLNVRENRLGICNELCPFCFIIVSEFVSVLL